MNLSHRCLSSITMVFFQGSWPGSAWTWIKNFLRDLAKIHLQFFLSFLGRLRRSLLTDNTITKGFFGEAVSLWLLHLINLKQPVRKHTRGSQRSAKLYTCVIETKKKKDLKSEANAAFKMGSHQPMSWSQSLLVLQSFIYSVCSHC